MYTQSNFSIDFVIGVADSSNHSRIFSNKTIFYVDRTNENDAWKFYSVINVTDIYEALK